MINRTTARRLGISLRGQDAKRCDSRFQGLSHDPTTDIAFDCGHVHPRRRGGDGHRRSFCYVRRQTDYQIPGKPECVVGGPDHAVRPGESGRQRPVRSGHAFPADITIASTATCPDRYRTEYDRFFDRNVVKILKAFQANDDIYYAYVINNDGFIPATYRRHEVEDEIQTVPTRTSPGRILAASLAICW